MLHRQEVSRVTENKKARSAGGAAKQAAGCDRGDQQSRTQYNTEQKQKTSIFDLLPVGAENAVSRRELSALTGIEDRQLRRQIAKERRAGVLILSSSESNGGYYRAASREELQRYVRSMQSRSKEILTVIRTAEEALQNYEEA